MGLFDFLRKPADLDEQLRKALVNFIFNTLTDQRGIRVEDALSAAATVVGERCIDVAGEFSLREHELIPGSHAFSMRINELICGDVGEDVRKIPPDSVIGIIRARLDSRVYLDTEFPDLHEVFKQFAAGIGKEADWGKVPLSVPKEHLPFISPLQIGYETRARVDKILAPIQNDKARCLRVATEALADILTEVASAIEHKLALTLAIETVNGMAKTASMTEKAMEQVRKEQK